MIQRENEGLFGTILWILVYICGHAGISWYLCYSKSDAWVMTTVLLKAHCQQWVQTTLPCLELLDRGGSLLGRASVSEAPSNLYLLARKYKGYDSNCSSCSTCEVHTPPTPPFRWALKVKDDFLMPAPVSPSLRALSGTKQNSLPGVNDSSFGSLQPMADSNWCINAPVHPPSGELDLGHGSYTISRIQLQSLTAIVGFITHPLLAPFLSCFPSPLLVFPTPPKQMTCIWILVSGSTSGKTQTKTQTILHCINHAGLSV